ncbi:major facilitator superfamily domain-containing protein [Aspergillus pseudoustus]|uniref:Major facilitator superfamily domain-containing protein n=1 Tax=Aspergillus pseudoustus TaxID=1810923 RepID=A0ABR4JVL2_9EURO
MGKTSLVEDSGLEQGCGGKNGAPSHEEQVPARVSTVEFTPEQKKKLIRKLDWIFLPQITLLYLLAYLDRGNIGNARIAGMEEDLNLDGPKYNIALMVFFIPYGLLEVPSNIVLKLLRPSIWIPCLVTACGIVMSLMGIVSNYGGLIAARFFLGVAEAGLFPGITFVLTFWYERYEVQTRFALFYAGASLAGAFSGLLAFAIQHMDDVAGLSGWRWVFILEGLLTFLCGIGAFFTLPDTPQRARFLDPDEKEFLISRLELETGSGAGRVTNEDKLSWKHVKGAFKEPRIWVACIMWLGNAIPIYGFTYTVPTVVFQLGYTAAEAQLMVVPIYICATGAVILVSIFSDRVQQRSPFVIAGFLAGAAGFLALLAIPQPQYPGLTYGFLFLTASGIFCPIMPALGWFMNNLAPSTKRAVGTAFIFGVANTIGGLLGSNIYMESTEPQYFPGYGVSFGIMITAAGIGYGLRLSFQRENAKRAALSIEEIQEKYTERELLDMGDKSPLFRYTL